MLARVHLTTLSIAALPDAQSVFHLFACEQAGTSQKQTAHLHVLNSNAVQALPGTDVELATQLPCKEDKCISDTKVTILLPQPGRARQCRGIVTGRGSAKSRGRGRGTYRVKEGVNANPAAIRQTGGQPVLDLRALRCACSHQSPART